MAPRIDKEKIKEIHRLRDEGMMKNQVQRIIGCTFETLERHWYDDDDEPGGYLRWIEGFSEQWDRARKKIRKKPEGKILPQLKLTYEQTIELEWKQACDRIRGIK